MASARPGMRRIVALSVVITLSTAMQVLASPVANAQQQQFVPISGSGSTWSSNALDQWRRNVKSLNGITINYAATGSTTGRNDFKNGTTDFGVSEIEYGLTDNGVTDTPPINRNFAYMPIVAGGTSFMYNLKIGNTQVTNLRLSGPTLAKIFTQQITNWADPAIKVDNPGLTLQARPIVPVVRSDGSGTTAQFTRWMAARYGAIWDAYCGRANCGFTSNYPVKTGIEAKSGSNGVSGEVASPNSVGAITYVEYSYARNSGFPVAKVLNDAGYYVEPKATSVAVALTQAVIRPDLTSDLSKVYSYTDPRTYPLSSYSYMIIPTDLRANFTADKGRTLSTFAYYFLCQGQQQADALGYSPLPVNLVKAGVAQVAHIPGTTNALSETNLTGCNNPTFDPANPNSNKLAQIAAQPAACDKAGPTQCDTGTAGAPAITPTKNTGVTTATTNGGSGAGGAGGGGPGTTTPAGAAAGAAVGAAAPGTVGGAVGTAGGGAATAGVAGAAGGVPGTAGVATAGTAGVAAAGAAGGAAAGVNAATGQPAGAGTAVDPDTGQVVDAASNGAGTGTALASNVSAIPVEVALRSDGQRVLLSFFAMVLLAALVVGPPLMSRILRHRRGRV